MVAAKKPGGTSSSVSSRTKTAPAMVVDKPKSSKSLPPLPTWELALCFGVWIGHAVYAWYVVWKASIDLESRLYAGFFEPGWRLLNYRRRDVANYEWTSWLPSLPTELAGFFLHVISLRIVERVVADKWKSEAILFPIWIVVLWMKLGWVGVVTTFVHGALMLTVARLTRWKLAVWLCACCLLATLASNWYPIKNNTDFMYRFAVYIAYKLLHFLSFCMNDIDAKRGKAMAEEENEDKELLCHQHIGIAYYAMMRYTLYPPYSATLIVIYADYAQQWTKRRSVTPDYTRIASVAIRVAFWTMVNDLVLHFFHCNAMMLDPYLLLEVDLVTLCAIGYTAGQYFHMKYVSIFGVNTIFGLLDGMTPPGWPPICISRVSLYSNMWRYFDRGLYAFLREHIFLPLAKPTFSIWRRTLASFVCFAFVWLWHGMSWAFVYWVGMNFIEITMENMAKEIYRLPSVYTWVNSTLSPVNVRRCRAMLHVVCTSWGVFSIFYFLGGAAGGQIFVDRIIIGEGLHLNLPLLYLVTLGYFFAQCCMEVEALVGPM